METEQKMEKQRKVSFDEMAVRLLGIIAVRGIPSKELPKMDQIAVLDNAGFTPKEIAGLINSTPNAVRVALFAIRKAEKKGRRVMRFPREEEKDE
jgi:hypothetical protein